MPESMGILHPGTSFGVFWSTNVARTWYRNEKYPLIPEKPGIRRGIPREGDIRIRGPVRIEIVQKFLYVSNSNGHFTDDSKSGH